MKRFPIRWIATLHLGIFSIVCKAPAEQDTFRPEAGKFPPMEKAHSYQGELTFVDHANRRGSIRIDGNGKFRFTDPSPFALLPYGLVRYQGAPADLRDIPLGTVMHVKAFLPPDPKISAVPVLPTDTRLKKYGNAGTGVAPAENYVYILEDEPSHCKRLGLVWKLQEVELKEKAGMIVARREPKAGIGQIHEETFSVDATTRFWRGRERLCITDLMNEKTWPKNGEKDLNDQTVFLGITWKPTPGGVFKRFHVSDIWLDELAMERAAQIQNETHKAFIRSRWMPGWVDKVEYGKFGRAKVTVTLFGGMDDSLYTDFKKGGKAMLASSENTLKHWAGGTAGTAQMASRGILIEVSKTDKRGSPGSSGIEVSLETNLVTEGFRPGKVIRIRPESWPLLEVPREEYIHHTRDGIEKRFPTPDIFPKY
ncbi:MAG: hypothetical protein O3A82_05000 [Verrucomicrobia bacterium]|jgi:hypothetical protein|nr:hypothetical protein [Verrucomicrobiota bacterium]